MAEPGDPPGPSRHRSPGARNETAGAGTGELLSDSSVPNSRASRESSSASSTSKRHSAQRMHKRRMELAHSIVAQAEQADASTLGLCVADSRPVGPRSGSSRTTSSGEVPDSASSGSTRGGRSSSHGRRHRHRLDRAREFMKETDLQEIGGYLQGSEIDTLSPPASNATTEPTTGPSTFGGTTTAPSSDATMRAKSAVVPEEAAAQGAEPEREAGKRCPCAWLFGKRRPPRAKQKEEGRENPIPQQPPQKPPEQEKPAAATAENVTERSTRTPASDVRILMQL